MKIANEWLDYELLLTKDGMKKEKWGEYTLVRPDPQIIWSNDLSFGNMMLYLIEVIKVEDIGNIKLN